MIARRTFVKSSLLLSSLLVAGPLFSSRPQERFKIGACDWSIGKSSDVAAFALAKEIGLQGLMVNMGSKSDNLHLRNKSVQQQFIEASLETKVEISSLAIGELNNYPFKSDPQTEEWVYDSITVAKNLKVPVVLLAIFNKNDLRNDEAGIRETISRLRRLAPEAEKQRIILGIESYLDAKEHLRIIDAVGSPNIKVYMDFRNTADAGHDVFKEVRMIGRDNICELHMKENGALLGKGTLPWTRIRDLLDELDYKGDGWMQIESSIPPNAEVLSSYKQNLAFLKSLFNTNS